MRVRYALFFIFYIFFHRSHLSVFFSLTHLVQRLDQTSPPTPSAPGESTHPRSFQVLERMPRDTSQQKRQRILPATWAEGDLSCTPLDCILSRCEASIFLSCHGASRWRGWKKIKYPSTTENNWKLTSFFGGERSIFRASFHLIDHKHREFKSWPEENQRKKARLKKHIDP